MLDLVSVIIPAYNSERTIHRAINSCLRQTHSRVEVIVINDGSTDDTSEILKINFESEDSVVIVNKENQGAGMARNDALDLVKGNYVCFLDSDDCRPEVALERYVEEIERTGADIVLAGYLVRSSKGDQVVYPNFYGDLSVLECYLADGIVSAPCLLYTSPSPRDRG